MGGRYEGEGSDFKIKVVQGTGALPSGVSQGDTPSAHVLGPGTLSTAALGLTLCHTFRCGGQVMPRHSLRGWVESAEPPTPSGLLDDFLLGDGRLGDGGGRLDDRGDGSWQELVRFRP